MKLKALFAGALMVALAFSFSATLSLAQTAPEFQLGFKALADQIPDVVGVPTENENFDPSTGNTEQRTTEGLLVWRKGDNWTAFTSGSMTWINGQAGVQSRLNTERFSWENTPIGAEAPRPVVKAAPRQPAVAPAARVQGSGSNAMGAEAAMPAAAATQAPAPAAAATQVPAPAAPAPSPAGTSKDACLGCHGPFDKLVSATAGYVWPKGGKENPHQYVPHGSQTVPDCSSCHNPHPVPPTAAGIAAMGKASPKLCVGCHPGGF